MTGDKPRSLIDAILAACLSLLVAAVALYAVARLIEAVWTALMAIAAGLAIVVTITALLRGRSRGW